MSLSKETKDRISVEAAFKADDGMAHWSPMKAYIAGAEAEAERAQGLVDNIKYAITALDSIDYHGAKRILKEALTKYNNSK